MTRVTEIEPNVDLLEANGRSFYLVGTAHLSTNSADLVERVIREKRPDTVCVELCDSRYEAISNPERWKETDIYSVVKSGRAYVLTAQLALSAFQKKLAKELHVRPGEEMFRAMQVARELGAEIALVDREVRTTLKRAWARAGLWSLCKVIVSLGASLFRTETVTAEEVEKLKAGDELAMLIDGFSGAVPGVKTALIDERDQYMSAKILAGPGRCVVAVVGAGHVPGIKRLFGSAIALDELEKVPPPKRALKVIGWGVPALLLVLVASGFFIAGRETGQQMIVAWSLANGISASIGTALALAHPLTIIAAFVAAPITSLNPTIAAGWVCGLVEAYLRKPRVVDLENVADDLGSIRGIWGNRVIKVLLVVVLANLGSSLGTLLGISWIISLLGG